MRVLNLNDAGIKLMSSNKKQIYLSKEEIKELLDNNYSIADSVLSICNKTLRLSNSDIDQFEDTFNYIKNHFEKVVK